MMTGGGLGPIVIASQEEGLCRTAASAPRSHVYWQSLATWHLGFAEGNRKRSQGLVVCSFPLLHTLIQLHLPSV